ncbi:HAMP domain-containing protein [Escherichia marmotae]|nr:HAMP domain-containing protein [Escherichia marmotae]
MCWKPPVAIVGSHFDSIAAGNLARPIAVYGRNEITAIFASLKTMQQALRGTVSDVRKPGDAHWYRGDCRRQ